jgi:spore germination protein KA
MPVRRSTKRTFRANKAKSDPGGSEQSSSSAESSDSQDESGDVAQQGDDVVRLLKNTFAGSDDFSSHPLRVYGLRAELLYLNGLVDGTALNEIQTGLFLHSEQEYPKRKTPDWVAAYLRDRFPFSYSINKSEVKQLIDHILSGNTLLVVEDLEEVTFFSTSSGKGRSIVEPVTEQVVRGPREGFIEDIQTNLLMLRRRVRTADLKVEFRTLGTKTQTQVGMLFIQDVADDGVVDEVRTRLDRIKIDSILESHYIESFIQDAPFSPFPTVFSTERVDRAAAALLEGRVVILVDGTPFVLTVPALFVEFLHSNEDYYDSAIAATLIRWLRAIGLFLALILPAAYVAITTIHQDLLQTSLLLRVAGYREDLPYPVLVEALGMQIIFEIVREAGLRMPKAIGNAVTIVGTLVIGQAAVQAGLVGSLMVIVIAVTALTQFVLPNYAFMQIIRYLSFPLLVLAGMFGFMGIHVGLLAILAHLTSLRSFGVPYLSPLSPAHRKGWKDVFYRAPFWSIRTRVPDVTGSNRQRAPETVPPHPPKRGLRGDEDAQ